MPVALCPGSVKDLVTYSTITAYSEDLIQRKGNIRAMTSALLLGESMPPLAASQMPASPTTPTLAVPATPARPAQPTGNPHLSIASSSCDSLMAITPGANVQISGLTSRPELNGQTGLVVSVDSASGRCEVRIGDTQSYHVRQSNLAPAQPDLWLSAGRAVSNSLTASLKASPNSRTSPDSVTSSSVGGPASASASAHAPRNRTPRANAKEILLVDEVDVFFGEDFYGKTFNPIVYLNLPEVEAILKAVWNERNARGQLFGVVRQSSSFDALICTLPEWTDILEKEVQAMCEDVQCFLDPKPHYDKVGDRLGYKVMDGIDYSVSYGYRTAFA